MIKFWQIEIHSLWYIPVPNIYYNNKSNLEHGGIHGDFYDNFFKKSDLSNMLCASEVPAYRSFRCCIFINPYCPGWINPERVDRGFLWQSYNVCKGKFLSSSDC